MKSYYHFVPGRIRVKVSALRHRQDKGEEAARMLEEMIGVLSVRFTAVTGSLLVHYDPDKMDSEKIVDILKESGLFDPSVAVSQDAHMEMVATRTGQRLGKAALGWMVGKALEANGLSLLAALI